MPLLTSHYNWQFGTISVNIVHLQLGTTDLTQVDWNNIRWSQRGLRTFSAVDSPPSVIDWLLRDYKDILEVLELKSRNNKDTVAPLHGLRSLRSVSLGIDYLRTGGPLHCHDGPLINLCYVLPRSIELIKITGNFLMWQPNHDPASRVLLLRTLATSVRHSSQNLYLNLQAICISHFEARPNTHNTASHWSTAAPLATRKLKKACRDMFLKLILGQVLFAAPRPCLVCPQPPLVLANDRTTPQCVWGRISHM